MILQTDTRLNANIQRTGCYFMSILYLANKHAQTPWDTAAINHVYEEAVSEGFMGANCFVYNPDGIFRLAGLRVRYTQHHEAPTRVCADNEIEILRFKHADFPGYSHFVVGNGIGFVTHDPWGVSIAATEGALKDKRIFRLEAA